MSVSLHVKAWLAISCLFIELVANIVVAPQSLASQIPLTAMPALVSQCPLQDQLLSMDFEGRHRLCLVHLPKSYAGQQKLPLLICLHGGAANFKTAVKTFGLNDEADKRSFIVAYPNGTSRFGHRLATWNSGGCCGYAYKENINDVGFIRSLLGTLEQKYAVDSDHVYVVGFSNGAMLAYRLAYDLPGVFAGIGSVSGWMNGQQNALSRPVSTFIVHGAVDKSVPVSGGSGKWSRYGIKLEARPLDDTVQYWVKNNGCSPLPKITRDGALTRYVYSGGKNNTEVELCLIDGYGHAWPGGRKSWLFAARPYALFSTNDALWEFFSKHSRQDASLNAHKDEPLSQADVK